MVSFLPLSHVAAQFSDLVSPLDEGGHLHFADPSALQGTLIQTLQEVRPHVFFSVPRVWEKIYDKMQEIANSNGAIKSSLGTCLFYGSELGQGFRTIRDDERVSQRGDRVMLQNGEGASVQQR